MSSTAAPPESSDSVGSIARYALLHPWKVFVENWNWKAALLSSAFRGVAFALPFTRPSREELMRSLIIEMVFRAALGGFWGSLLQIFRGAKPAWLADLGVAVVLPAAATVLEYAALRAGNATHIKTSMVVSIVFTVGSFLLNLGLMRRGLLITGDGAESLLSDLRHVPRAVSGMFRSLFENA